MSPSPDHRTTMLLAPLDPWLRLTNIAFDAWMGLWNAALPQQQAELMLQLQRQTLEAWTAPLGWALPAPEPAPYAAPRRVAMPSPAKGGPTEVTKDEPVAAKPITTAAERTDQPATEQAASPPRKAGHPRAKLRQTRTHEGSARAAVTPRKSRR